MNRRKCRRLLMILSGALLMLAALLLAFRNLWEERRTGCEAERVLTALRAALPETARQEDMVTLTVTDAAGNAVDWPMDASGAPMAWPLDGDGQPVAGMTDAAGRTVRWPAADGGRWTVTAAGLLPWATGSDGVTAQWPLNLRGLPCTLAELRAEWTRLTAGMRDLLAQPDFVLNPGKEMPTVSVDGSDCIGVLEVPALELSLPVMSGWSYPKPGVDDPSLLPAFQLFDMEKDVRETHNVIEEYPNVARELRDRLTKYVLDGRSTPGTPQANTGAPVWKTVKWLEEQAL